MTMWKDKDGQEIQVGDFATYEGRTRKVISKGLSLGVAIVTLDDGSLPLFAHAVTITPACRRVHMGVDNSCLSCCLPKHEEGKPHRTESGVYWEESTSNAVEAREPEPVPPPVPPPPDPYIQHQLCDDDVATMDREWKKLFPNGRVIVDGTVAWFEGHQDVTLFLDFLESDWPTPREAVLAAWETVAVFVLDEDATDVQERRARRVAIESLR